MIQVTIDNPIVNSPFRMPSKYFEFSREGITGKVIEGRRPSEYFVPVPRPKKQGAQLSFDAFWVQDRFEPNTFINRVRERVDLWRRGGYVGITRTTRTLLEHWLHPERERPLFFCQIEALETVIYITEVAHKYGDNWISNDLRVANEEMNPELFRIAFKMATGSGKTVVMAMLIAWQSLNKIANRQDARFTDSFLLIAPGITIRDRLRVLLPNDTENYYKRFDLIPPELLSQIGQAHIAITNFHALMQKEHISAGRLTKELLTKENEPSPFTETPEQMVRRVCRDLGNKKNIVVINDEAHHCYRARGEKPSKGLKGSERKEAQKRDQEARVWLSGLEAIKRKIGVKYVYDLSATPFYLKGSGYPEGKIFPWVVSDFSLIDAIESGVVKVPRVPVADNTMQGEMPINRNLWVKIRDKLPKRGRKQTKSEGKEPKPPAELEQALHSLYRHYAQVHQQWDESPDGREAGQPPPVFIVVANNTTVSKMVFDWIAGWEKQLSNGDTVLVPGQLPIFNNERNGEWLPRPNTILIDSEQLESGESMSRDFKKIASREIEDFKAEYRLRYPGRDADNISDEELLREVMNTVGKPGKLGEKIKCVVSVSMLTEGWDANTVTHIMGIRAFGTQLLCEQVIGRALRRISYAYDEKGMFTPEYADVYGVPFSLFMPTAKHDNKNPKFDKRPVRVQALKDREHLEITFPRVIGYRYDIPKEKLSAKFNTSHRMYLNTKDVPTETENAPIVGKSVMHNLAELREKRLAEVDFLLTKIVLEKYFRQDGQKIEGELSKKEHEFMMEVQAWRFPQILPIVREWRETCLSCGDDTFPQMLLLLEFAYTAADRIYQGIVQSDASKKMLKPILQPYETIGTTTDVDFDTTRPTFATTKSHVSHVACDSNWEAQLAQKFESMEEVICYVKNDGMGFKVPYTFEGKEKNYVTDYILVIDDGEEKPLKLVLEVSGEKRQDKAAKVATARNLWIPAINNHGGFGRWAFIEITDPTTAKQTIRDALQSGKFETRPILRAIDYDEVEINV